MAGQQRKFAAPAAKRGGAGAVVPKAPPRAPKK